MRRYSTCIRPITQALLFPGGLLFWFSASYHKTDLFRQPEAFQCHPLIPFLPGQWLDVHIPSISQAGGFTITSTPAEASYRVQTQDTESPVPEEPYIELAVQRSPSNPPAAWLWRPEPQIIGAELKVRVGGSFVWPPQPPLAVENIRKVVFVAGGVGIKYAVLSFITCTMTPGSGNTDATRLPILTLTQGVQTTIEANHLITAQPVDVYALPHPSKSSKPSVLKPSSAPLFYTPTNGIR
jgi:hypothetical protein